MLVASVIVMILSFAFEVQNHKQVHFDGLPELPMPPTCIPKHYFNIDCPGCGLTRAFVYIANGDFGNAWRMHRLGWLLFFATALQIPYRIHALRSQTGPLLPLWAAKSFGNFLIVMLIGNWLFGVIFFGVTSAN